MSSFIIFNGSFFPSGSPLLAADNRGFRYGDGLFETIRIKDGRILLSQYHFERLLNGCRLLGLEALTIEQFTAGILELCEKNGHALSARVRLTVFRGEMGRGDADTNYIIQSSPLDLVNVGTGVTLGVFPKGRKACDGFSQLKSNNYLIYSMAAMYARSHGWDDCLVLNSRERIADSSIANLFYVKGATIYTPPLSEGCVAGVMRRWLMTVLPGEGHHVVEKPVAPEDLIVADEVFLTNAIRGVRWVGNFAGTTYGSQVAQTVKKMVDEGLY
ncbi:MAG: aminotransferase class IV [Chitinophagaceae bacterium]|nr:aminotransferase class IV [Chitinophagaceae bacterium]